MTTPASKPLHLRLRDFVRFRSRPLRGFVKHRIWRRLVPYRAPAKTAGLHIGSGHERLEGWINIDIQTLPEVDRALDVCQGLPFDDMPHVFAEHFLEHLDIETALDFLVECHRVLRPDGWLRLSTPNLDWVWLHVYRVSDSDHDKIESGMVANRAFYGWQHRFLWNQPLLQRALDAAGFDVRWCRHGESEIDVFRGIERHETYVDTAEVPHVLIAEARKRVPGTSADGDQAATDSQAMSELRSLLERHFLRFRDC